MATTNINYKVQPVWNTVIGDDDVKRPQMNKKEAPIEMGSGGL